MPALTEERASLLSEKTMLLEFEPPSEQNLPPLEQQVSWMPIRMRDAIRPILITLVLDGSGGFVVSLEQKRRQSQNLRILAGNTFVSGDLPGHRVETRLHGDGFVK